MPPQPLLSLPDDHWISEVGEIPGAELVAWPLHEPHPRGDEIELVVPPYVDDDMHLSLLRDLPALRVVQLITAGYETVAPRVPEGVTLCNGAGIHDASTSELALTLILAALRDIPEFVLAQQDSRWEPIRIHQALADKRILVVGYGRVGAAVARRALAFETRVTAVASRAREGDGLVSQVHGADELPRLLPDHEVVVLVTPLTPQTRGLVDEQFLAAMPDGALLVNVARGPVVDTDALLVELRRGRLRAALDVTDPEPLPPDHPLWQAPNVLISPHVGGASTAFMPRAVRLLRRQLTAYASGRPLDNVVER